MKAYVHKTAEVNKKAHIGSGTKIWGYSLIREGAIIGKNCVIGRNVYIDAGVKIGDNTKIQNNSSIYQGVTIESGVFIGPHVCFTNDKIPRAINMKGDIKTKNDWKISTTLIKTGASIGANSTIVCGVTIGEFAMIGAGSVVTKSVKPFELAYGNPARKHGKVDKSGKKL